MENSLLLCQVGLVTVCESPPTHDGPTIELIGLNEPEDLQRGIDYKQRSKLGLH